MASSRALAWRSVLLDLHEGRSACDAFDTHPTPDLAVVVAIRGRHETDVHRNGRWRTAFYEPGAAGLVAPAETARLRWRGCGRDAFRTAHLYIAADLVASTMDEYRRASTRFVDVPVAQLAFRDPAIASTVAALIEATRAEAPDLYADAAARWLTTHLLSRHAQAWNPEDDRDPGIIGDRRLARVVEYIGSRLSDELRLEDLASEAGISVHHFSRVFRSRVGATPHAYVQGLRFDLAQRLLSTTDLPLGDISHRCGYRHQSAFSAAFQNRYGTSPSRYRAIAQR